MINTLPTANLERISHFDNAVFYCIDNSSRPIPVGVISHIAIVNDNKLEFSVSHFPVLENTWNVFAAELYFYKKGLPFNMKVHGTAFFTSKDELNVQFNILYVENFGEPVTKQYSLQETISGLLNSTSLFFRKMLVTGF